MKNLEVQFFGLQELNQNEMQGIDGGGYPGWARKFGAAYVVSEIISHWDEIKEGFSDGWNLK